MKSETLEKKKTAPAYVISSVGAPAAPAPVPPPVYATTVQPDLKVIDATSGTLITEASALLAPITSREAYTVIDTLVGKLAAARKGVKEYVETFFKKHIENAHKAHKDLCDDRTKYLAQHDKPIADLLAQAVALMRTFEVEEAARVKKAQDEAEAKRKEEEKAAADLAEANRKIQLKADEDAKLAKAQELEASGAKPAEIEKVLTAPPPPPPPPPRPAYSGGYGGGYVAPAPLKASNAGTRKNWTWRVKGATPEEKRASLLELAQAAVANPDAYLDFLDFNETALKAKAKSGEAQARCPGIEFYNDPTSSNRARA
jgi:hypothetical protein